MKSQTQNKDGQILIAYFSKTGNTRKVAEYISRVTGGDLFEIKTVKSYPQEYRPTTEVARKENNENARPELAVNLNTIASYKIIFLGYPNWWGTMPMAFFTFLESHDLTGKTIIPFCTNEGSGLGHSIADIQRLCPGVAVKEGLALRGGNSGGSLNEVSAWLLRIGITSSTGT